VSWLNSIAHRRGLTRTQYVPAPQEPVVGTVILRLGESYKVDIGAGQGAMLDGLAFEGASRRNRPNLKVCLLVLSIKRGLIDSQIGSLVYARVSLAHKDMDPELECFDAQTRKAAGFGELKGGFVTTCSLQMSRKCVVLAYTYRAPLTGAFVSLLDPNYFLLPLLGARFPLDVAVGVNGRVWVSCKDSKQTIAVVRCLEVADPEGGGKDANGIKSFLNTLEI